MVNDYYQKHKEEFWKEAPERHQNLSEEEKAKKRQYNRQRIKNLSEEEKKKKVEYMKNYYLAHKKYLLSLFFHFWGAEAISFNGLVLEIFKQNLKTFYMGLEVCY